LNNNKILPSGNQIIPNERLQGEYQAFIKLIQNNSLTGLRSARDFIPKYLYALQTKLNQVKATENYILQSLRRDLNIEQIEYIRADLYMRVEPLEAYAYYEPGWPEPHARLTYDRNALLSLAIGVRDQIAELDKVCHAIKYIQSEIRFYKKMQGEVNKALEKIEGKSLEKDNITQMQTVGISELYNIHVYYKNKSTVYGKSEGLSSVLVDTAHGLKVTDPQWLASLIQFESGSNPLAQNPFSSARGLIQFMNSTARSLGYKSANDLVDKYPDFDSQLSNPVKTYLSQYSPFPTEQSLYMSVFYPAARTWDPNRVFPPAVLAVNPGITTVQSYIDKVRRIGGKSLKIIRKYTQDPKVMRELEQLQSKFVALAEVCPWVLSGQLVLDLLDPGSEKNGMALMDLTNKLHQQTVDTTVDTKVQTYINSFNNSLADLFKSQNIKRRDTSIYQPGDDDRLSNKTTVLGEFLQYTHNSKWWTKMSFGNIYEAVENSFKYMITGLYNGRAIYGRQWTDEEKDRNNTENNKNKDEQDAAKDIQRQS